MNDPCYGCLIQPICCKMCDLVKPAYEAMVKEDKNFDWNAYHTRRDEIYRRMAKENKLTH